VKLEPGFNFVDLSSVGQPIGQSAATAINDDGLVVGSYTVGGIFSGFVWDTKAGGDPIVGIGYNDPAAQKLLSNSAYLGTRLLDVNHERIVGRIDFKGNPMVSFAFWISVAAAQNGSGTADFNVLKPHPADLPTSLDNFFHAHGVNDKNQIVGIYKDMAFLGANGKPPGTVGFVFTPDANSAEPWGGTFQAIAPVQGGQFTQLFGINNQGELIGDSGVFANDGSMRTFAYVWPAQNGNAIRAPELLPVVLAAGGAPFAIGHKISNNHRAVGEANQAVGNAGGPASGWQASLKPPPQAIVAGFQAIKDGVAYGSTSALGLNDPGLIVGSATLNPDPANPGNGSEAFVYVP